MNLEELRLDSAIKQKKGIHFILSSIIIWFAVLIIHLTSLSVLTKNLFTFCFTAPLMPLSYFVSKIIKVDFTNKDNPLTNLGILFSANQILYLLIAMWIYPTIPEKMLMVIAMIYGAHLLPYSWLYNSKSYIVVSILVPALALIVGVNFDPYVLSGVMIVIQILFCVCLMIENKNLKYSAKNKEIGYTLK